MTPHKPPTKPELTTLSTYLRLSPKAQGYVVYMEAEHEGSELKDHQKNPYEPGSGQYREWEDGQQAAVIEAQDSEE